MSYSAKRSIQHAFSVGAVDFDLSPQTCTEVWQASTLTGANCSPTQPEETEAAAATGRGRVCDTYSMYRMSDLKTDDAER